MSSARSVVRRSAPRVYAKVGRGAGIAARHTARRPTAGGSHGPLHGTKPASLGVKVGAAANLHAQVRSPQLETTPSSRRGALGPAVGAPRHHAARAAASRVGARWRT